jgi:hypothetical protein
MYQKHGLRGQRISLLQYVLVCDYSPLHLFHVEFLCARREKAMLAIKLNLLTKSKCSMKDWINQVNN